MRPKPQRYVTSQLDMKKGEQVRISYGRRTIFVYCNGRGLHISRGGYAPRRRAKT